MPGAIDDRAACIDREHLYRTLIESTRDLIYTVDRRGLFTYVNPQFVETTGYEASELMGRPFTDVVDSESKEYVRERFKLGMKGENSAPYEVNVLHRTGKKIPVEFLVTTLYDRMGSSVGRYGIGRDITERRDAAKALRENERILFSIVNGLSIPTFVIDVHHRIMFWNRALEELSAIKAAEVLGTTQQWRAFYLTPRACLADLLLDGDLDAISRRYREKCRKSGLIDGAYEVVDFFPHLGDRGKWLRFTGASITDLSGRLVGALETLEDITDQKQAEEALRDAEDLYRTLAEKSFAGVYVVQEGKFRFINDNAASFAGYSREELTGQQAGILVIPEDRERTRINTRAMLKGESTTPYEFRIKTKQGETHWIMETVTAIVYEGKPAILGNSINITERKAVEENLRASEERYRILFNNANDGVLIMKDMKFIDCNEVATKMFGCHRQQLVGSYPYEFSPPFQPDGLPSDVKAKRQMEAALSGVPQFFEWRHRRYDGTLFDSEVSLNAVRIREDVLIQALVRDITSRKQAEEALQRSEERYRNIIETIEDGYFEVDIRGNMTFCNPAAARMLAYSQEELTGMSYRRLMDNENCRKVLSAFNNVYKTGRPTKAFDWELIRKGGERLIVETSISLVRDSAGSPTGFRGIFRDITERKRMEEEIREMSLRDQLTGLYNRRGFITLAEQQLRAAHRGERPMMLSFIDVDGMKWINDNLGHAKGDRVLIDAANLLRHTFRVSDIIARVGGDEFAVLAIDMMDLNPEVLSQRLQRNIEEWNAMASRQYKLAISWGTFVYDPNNYMTLDQMMSAADTLMYEQKRGKINRRR
ncbi:MAG TPA: PAS domain S-box protein [Syntrophales bacterium]|nr:PAS domain S-box protein [Syntrophales bacterium]HPC32247.1 PAS domain S-box protein [Syntrophales bacterium]HQG34849.1 PAS domain S-box protein [Syntrophales bacterium]